MMTASVDYEQLNIGDGGSVGTLVGTDSPVLTEMISTLGFDFLFLDSEHGEISERRLVDHVMASRIPVLARLSDSTEVPVKIAADAGVWGLVVPHVRSAAMATDIVNWAKYAPAGRRSVGLSRNTLLGYAMGPALQQTAYPRVIAQIEDADGLGSVNAICQTEGLDGVFLGPYDLSVALGAPGDFTTKLFRDAVVEVTRAAHSAGLHVGVYAPSAAAWASFQENGCDYVVLGAATMFLIDGALRALQEIQA